MKPVQIIASVLFYITRILAFIYLAVTAYVTGILVAYNIAGSKVSIPVSVEGNDFTIYYPFTKQAFLLGENSVLFIATSLLTLIAYAVFLWLLSNVFNSFRQERLFTQKSIRRLSSFYIFNLTIPVITILVLFFLGIDLGNVLIIAFLHMLAGVFIYFMTAIFRQGLLLQNEQDLTL
jgi:hypothetical protein